MRKIIGFLGLLFLFLVGGFYLFYFYLPSLAEPEGLSLEVKTEKEVKEELGFLPIVSPSATVFLPEPKDQEALEAQQEKEAEQLQAIIDQEAQAAKKSKSYKRTRGSSIPANFQNLAPKVIEINLSAQTLSRWENGQKLDENRVSTGKRSMPTPTGVFSVRNKIEVAYSRKYRLYMPYWMAFTAQGHGIHELPVFRNGKREGANHLGIPVSHGCVRLGIGPAEIAYNWAEIGTPVVVHY